MPCTKNDIKNVAAQTVGPVYTQNNTTYASYNNYLNFQDNMWNHYLTSGCSWWANRVTLWTSQLPSITNAYHLALKQAKILFAQQMHVICGCSGPVPSISVGTSQKISSYSSTNLMSNYTANKTQSQQDENNIISGFILDTSNIKQAGEPRRFTILGDIGSVFSLQIRNEDNKYYNFNTSLFQTTLTGLDNIVLSQKKYSGSIKFPKVTDADKYDVYLFAENNTDHSDYQEVRFLDNSIDINSTEGSNSKLIQKVIYQTLDVTLTISGHSPNGAVTGTFGTKAITASREKGVVSTNFSFTATATSTRTYTVNRSPISSDVMAFITATPAATPIPIEGEDMYPAVTQTDVVDGDFSAGTTNKIVMDTNVADKMVVGDRITIATTALTDTVDGAVNDNPKVVMDNNVITKMAVGDRVTIVPDTAIESKGQKFLDTNIVTVIALNPDGDNAKEFQMSHRVNLNDGVELTFTSKLNREVITVAALNPDSDNVKKFSMKDIDGNSVNVGILDNTTLSFSNQRNHRWSFDNIHGLASGMRQLTSTYFTSQPTIKEYLTQTTINAGTADEYKIDNVRIPALEPAATATTPSTPITTRNASTNVETTVQTGNVTFDQQAKLTFGGGANATIFSYGTSEIKRLTGYDVEFSDLAVALTTVSTTTTSAVNASTSVPITERAGIADGISTVSGIGIASGAVNPTVSSGAGTTTGAGTIVLSAAQTLENGVTLTFPGAGTVATITGNIKVKKVGNADVTLRFDLEKLLTMQ